MKTELNALSESARLAFLEGRLEDAAALFAQAKDLALDAGDAELADRAYCNRCAVLLELDRYAGITRELKKVLLRSQDPKTRWMAAYYTAVAYDLDDRQERALDFAHRAGDLAHAVGEPETDAASANLLGNLALAKCLFEEAESAYGTALRRYGELGEQHRLMAAQVRDNLGYTYICTERVGPGIALCEQARNTMQELDARHYLAQPMQDLCYGYLLDARLEEAQEHGQEALELAGEIQDPLIVKNSLFLLAEVAVRSGDPFRARRYLGELAHCYPEVVPSEEIIDLFLAMDLTKVVNLRG